MPTQVNSYTYMQVYLFSPHSVMNFMLPPCSPNVAQVAVQHKTSSGVSKRLQVERRYYPKLSDFRKSTACWKVPRQHVDEDGYGALVG